MPFDATNRTLNNMTAYVSWISRGFSADFFVISTEGKHWYQWERRSQENSVNLMARNKMKDNFNVSVIVPLHEIITWWPEQV